ncbi:MAG: BON domain-containing protein [Gemmataceae bacterium]|nr:BON domain-containing protein [Gemmataceae bacterium]
MQSRRFLALALTAGVLFTFSPKPVFGQGTGTGTGSGASTGGLGATGLGAGGGGNIGAATSAIKGATSGAGSATSIPSNTNPFATTYVDFMSLGKSTNYSMTGPPIQSSAGGTYGKGIYTTTTTTTSTTGNTNSKQPTSFSTQGPRAPFYATVLADNIPLVVHKTSDLQNAVQAVLDRSNYIKDRAAVNFTVTGTTVELTGQVGTERERRTIEGMLRMTPGVRAVQNALEVVQAK